MFGRTSLTLYEGMTGLLENDFINVKNTSFEIVADIETGDEPANGVIVAQGGPLRRLEPVREGRHTDLHVQLPRHRPVHHDRKQQAAPGKSTVKMDFAYDGGKPGAGGTATLYINGKSVGSGQVEQTEFAIFSADETAGVGVDLETPVSRTTPERRASSPARSTR